MYFRIDSGFISGYRYFSGADRQRPSLEIVLSDYFDFGSGKLARKTVNQGRTLQTTLTIEKVRYNSEDSLEFIVPAAVRALLARKSSP